MMNWKDRKKNSAMRMSQPGLLLMLFFVLWLFVPWNSLIGRAFLNFGYVQLAALLRNDSIFFLPEEPQCPQHSLSPSDYAFSDSENALTSLEQSEAYQGNTSAYWGMGMIYLLRGDLAGARRVLQAEVSDHSRDSRIHVLLGCTYLQSGENDAAIAQWRSVPQFREWRIERGHVLRLQGDWEASNQNYYAAVALNPSSYLYHMIAWNHVKLGELTEAIAAYRRAIRLGQSGPEDYFPQMSRIELAKLLIAQQEWHSAKTELESIISERPMMAEAHEQLGVVYFEGLDDLRLATNSLVHAIEINPSMASAYRHLGSFNRRRQEYAAAEEWLLAGLALPHDMWTIWLHGELGRVYLEQGRYGEAIPELKAVIDAVPTDIWYLELLGDAHRLYGDLDAAAGYYQKALTLNPRHDRIRNKFMALGDVQP